MCAVARPSSGGVPRRAAPAGARALGTKKPCGVAVAPSARGVTMARHSSASRAGAGAFCATKKQIVSGVQVEVEVIVPAAREKRVDPAPGHLPGGALSRDPSACLAAVEVVSSVVPTHKRTRSSADTGVEVLTAGGDPALDRVHKRMASELEALRELLKKAELICRGPARKPEPQMVSGGKAPPAKRRRVSPLPEQNQKQGKMPQRMALDERKQLAGRLASLETVPDQIAEFLQKRLGGDADEIEIDFQSAEDTVMFELQARLDKLAAEERPGADAEVAMEVDSKVQAGSNLVADESRSDAAPEEQDEADVDICGVSDSDSDSSSSSSDSDGSSSSSDSSGSTSSSDSDSESDSDDEVDGPALPAVLSEENATSSQPSSEPAVEAAQSTEPEIVSGAGGGVGCTAPPALLPEAPQPLSRRATEVAQSDEPKKIQDAPLAAPKAVSITGVLYKAKTRRQLLEMEKAVVPDESIDERDLQRLCIAEYGHDGIMTQLGLFLKADM
ncbi:unnamed protein product [Urochloa decumbens]|uniref:NET domain-containing protein n=1 Tax=Urochloa decumbens TaxID=240449 RepID=A0ABC8ZVT7_9POAL